MNRKQQIGIAAAAVLVLAAAVIAVFAVIRSGKDRLPDTLAGFNDSRYTIGAVSGYIFGDSVSANLPEAGIRYFDTRDEAYRALLYGEVNGIADDEPIIRALLRSTDAFRLYDGYLEASDYSFVFPKTAAGLARSREFAQYVGQLAGTGELDKLDEKWFGSAKDNKKSEDPGTLKDINGTLRIAYDSSNIPFAYDSAGRPAGYDVDLAIGFCREYGYALELVEVEFSHMLDGVADAVYDAGCGAVTITEARKERLAFGSPDYSGGISICAAVPVEASRGPGLFAGFRRDLHRAFLENGRYRVLLKGIGITLLILAAALLLGTPAGIVLYMISRRSSLVFRKLSQFLVWLIHGLPAVIIMLFLYYRYYRDAAAGGLVACITGFVLVFAADVCRIVSSGAAMADEGRAEYDYRLEFTDSREFFAVLIREEGQWMLQAYREQAVSLLKMTAVAGCVAVTDILGAFETIRNESYEAVLPLAAAAAAYFIMIKVLEILLGKACSRIMDVCGSGADTEPHTQPGSPGE